MNRLVLINPSTSHLQSTARQMGLLLADLPPALYSAAPFALAPALAPAPNRMLPSFVEQLRRAPNEAAANTRKVRVAGGGQGGKRVSHVLSGPAI